MSVLELVDHSVYNSRALLIQGTCDRSVQPWLSKKKTKRLNRNLLKIKTYLFSLHSDCILYLKQYLCRC